MKLSKIEGIGLVFLLISFGWQVFEDEINSMSSDASYYYLHEKLDDIWMLNSAIYTNSEINKSKTISNIDYPIIAKNWKSYTDIKDKTEQMES